MLDKNIELKNKISLMKKPQVSIIMPTYNCSKYVDEAIQSVLDQTYSDWELLIMDDGSTDNTVDVISRYLPSNNIRFFASTKNEGVFVVRQKLINRAQGKYIAFLDGDDRWHPTKLDIQVRYMEENGIDFSCTAYKTINESGMDLHKVKRPPKKVNYEKCLMAGNTIGNLTGMYNVEKIGDVEIPHLKKRSDFGLWLNILKRTEYCYGINDILADYRVASINSISKNKMVLIKYQWKLYHDIEGLNLFKSSLAILSWILHKTFKV